MRIGTLAVGLLCALLGSGARGAPKPSADPPPAKVESLVRAEMAKRHVPGASIAVVRDGKPLLTAGYGLADVELNVPASPRTVYELASVTKQFTAMAVMTLVEEGKLALDDRIADRLPDLPPAWNEVRVRHLLSHTSGIKGYTETPGFEKGMRDDRSREEILGLVRQSPLKFKPGEKWAYSNTGYFLLGVLIEKASGKSYGEFLQEKIFKPLGMNATRVNDRTEILKNRASGYAWRGRLLNAERTSPTQPFSAGALVSTVEDMARWDAALYTEKLLKRQNLEQMWRAVPLADGKPAGYGFGWAVEQRQGHRVLGHGGGITGFSTQIDRYPDDRLTIVVLTNLEGGAAGAIARRVIALYIPGLTPPETKPIEDQSPQTTARLKSVLVAIVEGKADPEAFTPAARALLFPDRVKEGQAALSALGPLRAFELIESSPRGDGHAYRYRATFGTTRVLAGFALDREGKIDGLGLSPE